MAEWKKILTEDSSGDVEISGDLTVTGSKLTFGGGEFISNELENLISISSPDSGDMVFSILAGTDGSSIVNLKAGLNGGSDDDAQFWVESYGTDADSSLIFAAGGSAAQSWSLGKLGDSTSFIINQQMQLGVSTPEFELTPAGNLTITGDLTVTGNDIISSSATAITFSGADVEVVGDLTVTGADAIIGTDADGTDRTITFGHSTLKSIMGIDDSADRFVINTDASFDGTIADNDFSIDASGNIYVKGDLTVTGNNITGSAGSGLIEFSGNDIKLSDDIYLNSDYANIYFGASSSTDLSISGQGDYLRLLLNGDNTSSPEYPLVLATTTSGTPASGAGIGIKFNAESADASHDMGELLFKYTNIGAGAEHSSFVITAMDEGSLSREWEFAGSNSDLIFPNGDKLETVTAGTVNLHTNTLFIKSASDEDASLLLLPQAGYDAKVMFYESIFNKWTIGSDGSDDTDHKFHFGYSDTDVADASKMSLTSAGDLEITGELETGGDITIPAADKLILDGGLGRAYIWQSFANTFQVNVGPDDLPALSCNGTNFAKTQVTGGTITAAVSDDKILDVIATLNDTSDSGSMTFTLISGDITNTDSAGWDTVNLMDLKLDGTSKFAVSSIGSMSISRDITFGNGESIDNSADGTIKVNAATLKTGIAGYLTLYDNEIDVSSGNLDIDVAGSIILDSATGGFEMHGAGTVPKFADMYAGMILGYSRISNTGSGTFDAVISLTSSMTVLQTTNGTNVGVTFVAPPSGNVEIIFTCYLYTSSTSVGFALSDNALFNEIDPDHTYDMGTYKMDETDYNTISVSWGVTGLTAGTSYTYYIAGDELSGSTATISHGDSRGSGNHFPPITVKAVALPAAITTGS